jgi:hypothetical protein
LRFDNGVADSLAVLDTERTLINALDKVAQDPPQPPADEKKVA